MNPEIELTPPRQLAQVGQRWIWKWIQRWRYPPNQLRLDKGGARHGVDTPFTYEDGVEPQIVEHKYESGEGSRDGV